MIKLIAKKSKSLPLIKALPLIAFLLFVTIKTAGATSFSGFVGANLDLLSNQDSDSFDGQLKIQSFFSGELNIINNLILRAECFVATNDLIDNAIFNEAPATFKLNELSLLYRAQLGSLTNYLTFFIGDYEPMGSDIFLQRQFGIKSIASKITSGYIGLNSNIIYPMSGVGGADVLHFANAPIATGLYIYVNHALDKSYDLNAAWRFGFVTGNVMLDFVFGVGIPLVDNSESKSKKSKNTESGEDTSEGDSSEQGTNNTEPSKISFLSSSSFMHSPDYNEGRFNYKNAREDIADIAQEGQGDVSTTPTTPTTTPTEEKKVEVESEEDEFTKINKVYLRCGLNLLFGNQYTSCLFIQAGFVDLPVATTGDDIDFDLSKLYVLFEPRFYAGKAHCDITLFSIPQSAIPRFSSLEGTMGANLNIYSDTLYLRGGQLAFGANFTFSMPKDLGDLTDPSSLLDDYYINVAPYLEAKVYNGILNFTMRVNVKNFIDNEPYKAFKFSLGYKTQI